MKVKEINGKKYRLSSELNDFQQKMYVNLIDWKWSKITKEPGFYKGKPYDALLPDELKEKLHPLYEPIIKRFK